MLELFALTRRRKITILVMVDILFIVLSCVLGYLFMMPFLKIPYTFIQLIAVVNIVLYLFYGYLFHVFTRINRYTNLREMIAILLTTTFTAISNLAIIWLFTDQFSKRLVFFVYILSTFLIIMSRLTWRFYTEIYLSN